MDRVYTICMAIGLGIPLISLILGGIGDFFEGLFEGIDGVLDGLDLNFEIDIGDTSIALLPFSVQSICAGLLVFGGAGKLIYNGSNGVAATIAGAAGGYLTGVVIQTLIRKLKAVEHTTYSKEQLLLFDATVINTIIPGGYGSISVKTFDGITTAYPARAENQEEAIRQDTVVSIIRFDKNTAIVRIKDPAAKYAGMQDQENEKQEQTQEEKR